MNKAIIAGLATLCASSVHAADNPFSLTVGSDYSKGKYGDTVATETWAYPVMAKYENDAFTWKASVPYVWTRGPSNVVGTGADRVVTGQAQGATRSVSGWGDAVGSLVWSFYQSNESRAGIDLVGKVKLATGDKSKGLSTGENDYSLQFDGYRSFGSITALGTLGKKVMGDPAGVDYRDPWFASVGAAHRISATTSWGGTLDFRERLTNSGAPVREAMFFLSHRFSPAIKLQAYLVKGYSDASPDNGGGLMLGYGF